MRAAQAVFGGFKQSVVDRDKAPPVFAAYTERHTNPISFCNLGVLYGLPAFWRTRYERHLETPAQSV
jgi:hypothetical protein